jgi:hypothetical protein
LRTEDDAREDVGGLLGLPGIDFDPVRLSGGSLTHSDAMRGFQQPFFLVAVSDRRQIAPRNLRRKKKTTKKRKKVRREMLQ